MNINYTPPGPMARGFMLSNKFVRGLRGPIGSGKSAACCMEAMRRFILDQHPQHDGIRRSRGLIVRNTYSELRETTIKTWSDWFPEKDFGKITENPPPFRQMLRFGDVEAEILFMALDRPEDVKKLLSLELTWAWVNEAREVPKPIIDAITSRLRRYPALKDGGAKHTGLIMDTNSPDELHWWPIMAGDVPPPEGMTAEEQLMLVQPVNWEFFTQPPAMLEERDSEGVITGYSINPEAENIANLDQDYYPELVTGKTRNWINVYVMNRIGADFDGRKVHPHFAPETHVVDDIDVAPGALVVIGADFGLTPAAVFWQQVNGQWRAIKEIVLANADAEDLSREINRELGTTFAGCRHVLWGDPAGDTRVGTNKKTPFMVLRANGIIARPTENNDPSVRRASLTNPMRRMHLGQPGIAISKAGCPVFVMGLSGGWHYPRIRTAVGETYGTEPAKNRYSHVCEAGEYGLQGGGEGRKAVGKGATSQQQSNGRAPQDPLARLREQKGRPSGRQGAFRP